MSFGRNVNRTSSSRRWTWRFQGFGIAPRVLKCSQDFGVFPRILELFPGFWSCSQDFGVVPRILELIPGFWSWSQDFGVDPRILELFPGFCSWSQDFGVDPRVWENIAKIYSTFCKKFFKKGTLKPKIGKRALLPFFANMKTKYKNVNKT